MSDQFFGSLISGKSNAEIEAMIARAKLSPKDKLYTIVRNSFIDEAERCATNKTMNLGDNGKGRFNQLFFKRMDELMQERGLTLLRAAGVMK